eukprot:m51a1_g144 putative dolichol-phosphate mannosyltransferase (381) ;mRNA; f:464020-465291
MSKGKLLTVIVPTYNEKGNMRPLITGVTQALERQSIPHEILVMDDNSPDGTAQECERLRATFPHLRCVVRTQNRGLSPSVIDGFHEAKGDVVLVMDADLSHPVEVVPKLYAHVASGGADIAVGSRHCKGGEIAEWPLHRRVISWGAALLARPLSPCSDPMSGFFAFRPAVIKGAKLSAAGFKILLEVLVKGDWKTLREEPITFKDRTVGESKLTRGVMVSYVLHLASLYLYPGSAPLLKFLAIGALGAALDISLFTALLPRVAQALAGRQQQLQQLPFACDESHVAQALSFCAAVLFNFVMNRLWTFGGRAGRRGASACGQFVKFVVLALLALATRTVLFAEGKRRLGVEGFPHVQILLACVIVAVTAINFLGSKYWAFK